MASDSVFVSSRRSVWASRLIRDLPRLGTGKVNHRELEKLV